MTANSIVLVDDFNTLFHNGHYKILIELSSENLDLPENQYWYVTALWKQGEFEKAIDKIESFLKNEKLDNYWKGQLIRRLATIQTDNGRFEEAQNYLEKSLKYFSSYSDKKEIASIYSNLANLHITLGHLEKSREYRDQSIKVYKELGSLYELAIEYNDMSDLFIRKGEHDRGLAYLQRSYELLKSTENVQILSTNLSNQIMLLLDMDRRPEVEPLILELEEILRNNTENGSIALDFYLARGLFLKSSKRLNQKFQAIDDFTKIVQDLDIIFEITLYAIYHLIELYIIEYQTNEEPIVLDEIMKYLDIIYKKSQKKQIFPFVIRSLILRAKLLAAQGDFKECRIVLDQAMYLADEKELYSLRSTIKEEKQKITTDLKKYDQMIKDNLSLVNRIRDSDIVDYIHKAMQEIEGN